MKTISTLIAAGTFLIASSAFAANPTSLAANWTCKTNASSATTDAEKAADKLMSENTKSASEAFDVAAKNCRDCTKITCKEHA